MDAEGLGRKLLLTPSGGKSPGKADHGYCDSISQNASPVSEYFRALSRPALQRGAAWAAERLLGAHRQSVPQNDRVHLHIIPSYST